jgi:hypothetical protein
MQVKGKKTILGPSVDQIIAMTNINCSSFFSMWGNFFWILNRLQAPEIIEPKTTDPILEASWEGSQQQRERDSPMRQPMKGPKTLNDS